MAKFGTYKEIGGRYFLLFLLSFLLISSFFVNSTIFLFNGMIHIIMNIFVDISLNEGILEISGSYFRVVEACIAPSIYIFISIVFFTLGVKIKDFYRDYLLSLLFITIFNLLRIILLIIIGIQYGNDTFDKYHFLFYELFNGLAIGLILFFLLSSKKYKGKIPLWNDIKRIFNKNSKRVSTKG